MAYISVTNALNDNSATSDITLVGTNFTDITNGLSDGTKDINVAGITAAGTVSFSAGNMAIEGKAVDIVQVGKIGIADNDTSTLTFAFVPSKIVVNYSECNDGPGGAFGRTTGQCVITITGTDTFTSNLNHISRMSQSDFINRVDVGSSIIVRGYGGASVNSGSVIGTGTWVTATKTLTITWQETNTVTATNVVELVATAYK